MFLNLVRDILLLDNLDVVLLYLDSIKLSYKSSLCNQIIIDIRLKRYSPSNNNN